MLERVNEHLCPDMPAKMFVTCLYGVLDPATGRLRFANAGHDLPYVKTADGVVELRARGMPLGLMPGMHYEEKEIVLAPGDSVLLHSDGIVEAHAPDREMFGFPRLHADGRRPRRPGADRLRARRSRRFTGQGGEQEDDITMVTLERSPGAATRPTATRDVLAEFELPSAAATSGRRSSASPSASRALGPAPAPPRAAEDRGRRGDDERHRARQREPTRPARSRSGFCSRGRRARAGHRSGERASADAETPDLEAKLDGLQSPAAGACS